MEKERGKLLKDVATKHRKKLYEIAQNNTRRNEDGLTVIEKDDPWRDDDDGKSDRYRLIRDGRFDKVLVLR